MYDAQSSEPTIDNNPKIYIAGPMTGYPKLNSDAFSEVAEAFREAGFDVFNPVDHDIALYGQEWIEDHTGENDEELAEKFDFDYGATLADELHWICTYANAVAMLPGWEHSKGARAEHAAAVACGLKIFYLSE